MPYGSDVSISSDPTRPERGPSLTRSRGLFLSILGLAAILSLTLWPSPGESSQVLDPWCLFCGSRGLADAFLNVVLFFPFGAGISVLFGPAWGVIASAFLSGGIEIAQVSLPGRFPTVGDLLWNTAGGGLGAVAICLLPRIRAGLAADSIGLRVGAYLFPTVVFLMTAVLVSPRYPSGEYHGQWTRDLGSLVRYQGEILESTLGGEEIPDRRIGDGARVRELLEAGEPLRFSVTLAAPPDRKSHVLAIFDHRRTEVFLVTASGEDLFYQRRSLSSALRLEEPIVRWEGGMAGSPGERLDFEIRETARELCLGRPGELRCDLPMGVEGGWRLLHRMEGIGSTAVLFLSIVWLVILTTPAGMVCRGPATASVGGVVLGLSAVTISWVGPFMAPHLVATLAPVLGVWVGQALRRAWIPSSEADAQP